jgi:uncharacterized protein (DUF1810 family)
MPHQALLGLCRLTIDVAVSSRRLQGEDEGVDGDVTEIRSMSGSDRYGLERFVRAQDRHGTYAAALGELRGGRKMSHWMWFVFPQVAGLGYSEMSKEFAISSLGEAQAYVQHRVLGPRLVECAGVVLERRELNAADIFGDIDAQKFHSSMTLFMRAAPDLQLFRQVLDQFFEGIPDRATDDRL